jgi:hypothetical protein
MAEGTWQGEGSSHELRSLAAMARYKEGASAVKADLHAALAPISMEEWLDYWGRKSGRLAAGLSGVGPSLVKAAPRSIHRVFIRLCSACLRLKINPAAWKREQVVPIPKKPGVR